MMKKSTFGAILAFLFAAAGALTAAAPLCAVAGPAAKHPPCVHPSHLADQRVLRHSRRPGAGGLRLGQPRGAERGIRGAKRICGHYAPVAAGIKSKQSGMAFDR